MTAARIAPALAGAWCLPALAPVAEPVARALGVARRLARPGVAVTFDDGPHPLGTPAVLEALAAATFFMVGERVAAAPELAAEVVARGHAVAIHGDRHRSLLRLTPAALAADLDRAHAVIAAATGRDTSVHRPPYGVYSWPAPHAVRARGWTPLLWSRWGHDWRRRTTAQRIAAEVSDGVRAGDVLLLHDGDDYSAPGSWRRTAAALPRVLESIAAAGLETVAVTGAVLAPPG